MCASPRFLRKYALSILAGIVLCSVTLNSACNSSSTRQSDHPTTAEGTEAAAQKQHDQPSTAEALSSAVKESVTAVEKSLADLPLPPSAPAVCDDQLAKSREAFKAAPGTDGAAKANSALLRCISKATNEARCKGKPQPCGVVYYNPPIKPAAAGQPAPKPSEPRVVDVSAPDQVIAACTEIAEAAAKVSSTSAEANSATGTILASVAGDYNCGAWFKAAAKNDPTLLINPLFVPTTQLIRDLKTFTKGVTDVTPEAELASSVKRVDIAVITIRVGGSVVPVAVLPFVPVGSTSGQVAETARLTVPQRINQIEKSVADACKAAGICP